jgi:beta-lactam-binding protein with PASTA domain
VLKGLTEDKIDGLIAGTDWEVKKVYFYRDNTDEGDILAQYPEPYDPVPRGGQIGVEISKGPTLVDVPTTLPGKQLAVAREQLENAGLKAKVVEEKYDENAPAQQVISVGPDTKVKIPKGREVGLIVSKGPQPRTVPAGLETKSWEEAAAAITALQLKPNKVDMFNDTVPAGAVIAVDPPPGTQVERGAQVNLTVSKGKNVVKVPDVTGRSVAEAIGILQSMGLKPDVAGGLPIIVRATNPPAGTEVPPGTTIQIQAGI